LPSAPSEEGAAFASPNYLYRAPECYNWGNCQKNDVLSFGLILYKIVAGILGFPEDLGPPMVTKMIVVDEFWPPIPDRVDSAVRELITAWWAQYPGDRPSFEENLVRLNAMDLKVTPGVNALKVGKLVAEVEEWETTAVSVG
jgi:hypothetical protein